MRNVWDPDPEAAWALRRRTRDDRASHGSDDPYPVTAGDGTSGDRRRSPVRRRGRASRPARWRGEGR